MKDKEFKIKLYKKLNEVSEEKEKLTSKIQLLDEQVQKLSSELSEKIYDGESKFDEDMEKRLNEFFGDQKTPIEQAVRATVKLIRNSIAPKFGVDADDIIRAIKGY